MCFERREWTDCFRAFQRHMGWRFVVDDGDDDDTHGLLYEIDVSVNWIG